MCSQGTVFLSALTCRGPLALAGECAGFALGGSELGPAGVLCCKLPGTHETNITSAVTAASTTATTGTAATTFISAIANNANNAATAIINATSTTTTTKPAIGDAEYSLPGLLTWDGDALHGMYVNLIQPANLEQWSGGLAGGPMVFYATSAKTNATTSAVLGPSSRFKTGIMSRVGDRLVAGISGMVTEIPGGCA